MFNARAVFHKLVIDSCVCKNIYNLSQSKNLCSLIYLPNVCGKKVYTPSTFQQTRMCKPYFYCSVSNTVTNRVEHVIESQSELYSNVDYNAITGGDEDILKKLKILMLEVEVMRQDGHAVPSKLNTNQWKELLELPSRSRRRKYLQYMFKTEMKILNEEAKKAKRRQETLKRKEIQNRIFDENEHIIYGFKGSTIFLRVYDTTMNMHFNNRLVQAMQFGEKLVIDCGYEEHMNNIEAKNCAKQLMLMFASNRQHNDPYDLYFCNANPEYRIIKQFERYIPTLYEPDFPINISEKHYLDLFPKEKLVYLTPHCHEELKEYDHDAIYIIGEF